MDLFDEQLRNLLHRDGTVNYYGTVMPVCNANDYLEHLINMSSGKMMRRSSLANELSLSEK